MADRIHDIKLGWKDADRDEYGRMSERGVRVKPRYAGCVGGGLSL